MFLESGRLVSVMSTVREDNDGCAEKYRCALPIYLMTVFSSSYYIIIDRVIIAPGHGNNVVYVLNTTENRYLKEKMELISKLSSNDTIHIGMLPRTSKYVWYRYWIIY